VGARVTDQAIPSGKNAFMISRGQLRIATFPGAANVPLYAGVDAGAFAAAGLGIELIEVGSSTEQLEMWDSGHCDVMHTSPDHLLREQRPRDPVVVRRDGFGELQVYRRPEQNDVRSIVWAVDALATGFAFLLRAILEEEAGIGSSEQRLEAVGGTKQGFEALMNTTTGIGGTTLHPPFDGLARSSPGDPRVWPFTWAFVMRGAGC
jgi:hypothetical protein